MQRISSQPQTRMAGSLRAQPSSFASQVADPRGAPLRLLAGSGAEDAFRTSASTATSDGSLSLGELTRDLLLGGRSRQGTLEVLSSPSRLAPQVDEARARASRSPPDASPLRLLLGHGGGLPSGSSPAANVISSRSSSWSPPAGAAETEAAQARNASSASAVSASASRWLAAARAASVRDAISQESLRLIDEGEPSSAQAPAPPLSSLPDSPQAPRAQAFLRNDSSAAVSGIVHVSEAPQIPASRAGPPAAFQDSFPSSFGSDTELPMPTSAREERAPPSRSALLTAAAAFAPPPAHAGPLRRSDVPPRFDASHFVHQLPGGQGVVAAGNDPPFVSVPSDGRSTGESVVMGQGADGPPITAAAAAAAVELKQEPVRFIVRAKTAQARFVVPPAQPAAQPSAPDDTHIGPTSGTRGGQQAPYTGADSWKVKAPRADIRSPAAALPTPETWERPAQASAGPTLSAPRGRLPVPQRFEAPSLAGSTPQTARFTRSPHRLSAVSSPAHIAPSLLLLQNASPFPATDAGLLTTTGGVQPQRASSPTPPDLRGSGGAGGIPPLAPGAPPAKPSLRLHPRAPGAAVAPAAPNLRQGVVGVPAQLLQGGIRVGVGNDLLRGPGREPGPANAGLASDSRATIAPGAVPPRAASLLSYLIDSIALTNELILSGGASTPTRQASGTHPAEAIALATGPIDVSGLTNNATPPRAQGPLLGQSLSLLHATAAAAGNTPPSLPPARSRSLSRFGAARAAAGSRVQLTESEGGHTPISTSRAEASRMLELARRLTTLIEADGGGSGGPAGHSIASPPKEAAERGAAAVPRASPNADTELVGRLEGILSQAVGIRDGGDGDALAASVLGALSDGRSAHRLEGDMPGSSAFKSRPPPDSASLVLGVPAAAMPRDTGARPLSRPQQPAKQLMRPPWDDGSATSAAALAARKTPRRAVPPRSTPKPPVPRVKSATPRWRTPGGAVVSPAPKPAVAATPTGAGNASLLAQLRGILVSGSDGGHSPGALVAAARLLADALAATVETSGISAGPSTSSEVPSRSTSRSRVPSRPAMPEPDPRPGAPPTASAPRHQWDDAAGHTPLLESVAAVSKLMARVAGLGRHLVRGFGPLPSSPARLPSPPAPVLPAPSLREWAASHSPPRSHHHRESGPSSNGVASPSRLLSRRSSAEPATGAGLPLPPQPRDRQRPLMDSTPPGQPLPTARSAPSPSRSTSTDGAGVPRDEMQLTPIRSPLAGASPSGSGSVIVEPRLPQVQAPATPLSAPLSQVPVRPPLVTPSAVAALELQFGEDD